MPRVAAAWPTASEAYTRLARIGSMPEIQGSHIGRASDSSRPAGVWSQPSSSRMLASYLSDVEQMLDEQRWDIALRDAVELPRIAVALVDPRLSSSSERCRAWCEEWVKPSEGIDGAADKLRQVVSEYVDHDDHVPGSVPTQALRRLRLRRHARVAPRGFGPEAQIAADAIPETTPSGEVSRALVNAMRRWYAQSGCHDATTQSNLARLAVLR